MWALVQPYLHETVHKIEEGDHFWEKHTHDGGGERVYTHTAGWVLPISNSWECPGYNSVEVRKG